MSLTKDQIKALETNINDGLSDANTQYNFTFKNKNGTSWDLYLDDVNVGVFRYRVLRSKDECKFAFYSNVKFRKYVNKKIQVVDALDRDETLLELDWLFSHVHDQIPEQNG